MNEFVDNVKVLINALGYKVLEPLVHKSAEESGNEGLFIKTGNAYAEGVVTAEGFVVMAGARINVKTSDKSLSPGLVKLRNKLMNSDKVKDLTTKEDILFSRSLIASGADITADVVAVPHHGSKYSSTVEFIKATRAKAAVIQVGKNNYGHPAPEVIRRYKAAGVRVYRNDQQGAVGICKSIIKTMKSMRGKP